MFHVERDLGGSAALPAELEPPAAAAAIFGDRLEIARRYCAELAGAGVERGLIGPREVPRLWDRHILNCAVVGELIPEGASVVDVGSGAGLPGIPLAIARPDLRITLVEPLLRRTLFLSDFIDAAGLEIIVVRGRAEQSGVLKEAGGADVVTSRAVAPLAKLAQWSIPLLHDHGRMLALKGISAVEELERDADALTKIGAGNAEILRCGVTLVSTPTVVISAERLPRAERPSRRSEGGAIRRVKSGKGSAARSRGARG
ncbi:16S rRNA (guanine(527)-N(7))-methyltransferase RsmG [Nocardia bovistercoris]|uniref:Ribosomal RNA small subunit methyltransferase G n=1 Tax=Nocardia bovistercoris TaxID=2785916 RepID=A0A931N6R6_9NOCA|nr:16S rRNA (guanine(527)-N(7))-methyltransferase RsmG [Nocardia bovistercoris]MBH0781249.1 16S rRNA (guanine(527)-N(7))-methyltransferase RsmG [Nocardia bovistercoris]